MLTGAVLYSFIRPRLVAEMNYRARLLIARRYAQREPRQAEETDEDYLRRIHREVLHTLGIPPLAVVQRWLRRGATELVPPADVLEAYLYDGPGQVLASGKPDPRIGNGEGERLLDLLRERRGGPTTTAS